MAIRRPIVSVDGRRRQLPEGDTLPPGEWAAETVGQEEAEAGAATTRRAWTAQRVRQAIVAWWNSVTSTFGRSFVAVADASAGRVQLNCANKSGDTYTGQHNYGNTGSLRFTGTSSTGSLAAAASSGGVRFSVAGAVSTPLFIDFDGSVPDSTSTLTTRFFRSLNTTGACTLTLHKGNGTVDTQHTIDGKGAVRLNRLDGETVIGAATSNGVDKLQVSGSVIATGAVKLATFTLATLPAAAANARGLVYVSNLTGQAAPCYSDGTNWRRVSDNTVAN